jgi:Zn-dependent protease
MDWSFRIGKIFGRPVYLHFTWALIAVLILAVTVRIFPEEEPLWLRLVGGVVVCIFWFSSVATYELIRSRVAIRNRIPVKGITLFVFGGVPRVAREARGPWADIKVAIAGLIFGAVVCVVISIIWMMTLAGNEEPFADPLFLLGWVFLCLFTFNLLPGYPLSGGRVLRALIWWVSGDYRISTRIASIVGQVIAFGLIFAGIVVMLTGGLSPFNGLFIACVGWFLESAASATYRQANTDAALKSVVANDVLWAPSHGYPRPYMTVGQLMQEYVLPGGGRFLPVVDEGRLVGILTAPKIKSVPEELRDGTSVIQIASTPDVALMVDLEEDGVSLMERMDECNTRQLVVIREGVVLGIVTRDDLLQFTRVRRNVEGVEHSAAPC